MELQNEFRINYFKFEIKRKIVQMISNKFVLWQEKKTDYNKNILYIFLHNIINKLHNIIFLNKILIILIYIVKQTLFHYKRIT